MDKELIDSLRTLHDLSKAINSTLDIEEVAGISGLTGRGAGGRMGRGKAALLAA